MNIDRSKVVSQLKESIVHVRFTKANGEIRDMKATLNPMIIPEQVDESEIKRIRRSNPEVLPVYDVEANGWRSFRWDSVQEVTIPKEITDYRL